MILTYGLLSVIKCKLFIACYVLICVLHSLQGVLLLSQYASIWRHLHRKYKARLMRMVNTSVSFLAKPALNQWKKTLWNLVNFALMMRNNKYRKGLDQILTHWGRVTHICVGKLTIIGSDNGLAPGRHQTIIWTNDGILLIGPLGTNFSEILIGIQTF